MYKDCHKETVKSRRKIDTIVFKIISKIDIQWQKQTLCGLNRYHILAVFDVGHDDLTCKEQFLVMLGKLVKVDAFELREEQNIHAVFCLEQAELGIELRLAKGLLDGDGKQR